MNFLPSDYSIPNAQSGYMKLEQGSNRFRVLSSAIVGTEYWKDTDEGRKPIRKRPDERISGNEINPDERPKHFWAFVVWNYESEMVQILELTQKTIMRAIRAYTKDDDFGDPKGYDIVINREGEGLETEYTTRAKPPKKLDEDIKAAYESMDINLEALYDGEDPFASIDDVVDEVAEALEDK